MNTPNDNGIRGEGESSNPPAPACDCKCACHSTSSLGRLRWLIGIIILAAAGVLVARAIIKNSEVTPRTPASTFVNPIASQTEADSAGSATARKSK